VQKKHKNPVLRIRPSIMITDFTIRIFLLTLYADRPFRREAFWVDLSEKCKLNRKNYFPKKLPADVKDCPNFHGT
jgi:hypothetical protein